MRPYSYTYPAEHQNDEKKHKKSQIIRQSGILELLSQLPHAIIEFRAVDAAVAGYFRNGIHFHGLRQFAQLRRQAGDDFVQVPEELCSIKIAPPFLAEPGILGL